MLSVLECCQGKGNGKKMNAQSAVEMASALLEGIQRRCPLPPNTQASQAHLRLTLTHCAASVSLHLTAPHSTVGGSPRM